MSDLSSIERLKFEALFDMESGYVLDFSNNTFSVFTIENVSIDIFDSKYEYGSSSKANRLRKFWQEESNEVVGKLLSALLDYWLIKKQISEAELSSKEKTLYDECQKTVNRLNQDTFRQTQGNTPSPLQKGRIFISYRRIDSAGYAGRIYDRLVASFGENAIFMDVDTIEGGVDFIKVLEDAVQSCDVLIALIGRQWLSVTDKDGKRRLDSPEDFVRIEIAVALKRNIRVIPVLVDGVDMPQPIELPENLKALARRNALQVNHHSFNPDIYRLIEHSEAALEEAEKLRVMMKAQALQTAREKASREKAERETVENAVREKAEKEKAEREAAEKVAREKVERESAEKARLEAEEQAKQKAAKEKADCEAAEKVAREKAEQEAAEKARLEAEEQEKQKATKEKAERETAEKISREKVEHKAIEKTTLEQSELETVEEIAPEQANRESAKKSRQEKAEGKSVEKTRFENVKSESEQKAATSGATFGKFAFGTMGIFGIVVVCIIGILIVFSLMNSPGGNAAPMNTEPTLDSSILINPEPTSDNSAQTNPGPTLENQISSVPTEPVTSSTEITDAKNVPMSLVSAGDFMMAGATNSSEPFQTIYLDAFYIDTYEVTNASYKACFDNGGCLQRPQNDSSNTRTIYYGNSEFDNFPVIYVDWYMAKTYCEWRGARLPTEAEWEKAARGTDGRDSPWGNAANFNDFSHDNTGKGNSGDTTEVGSYETGKSPYDVYDMGGNVWEWVSSIYKSYPYDPNDGRENLDIAGMRVLRGGSWKSMGIEDQTNYRYRLEPTSAKNDIGFRCARDATP